MFSEVFASLMFPSQGSYRRGPPSLLRVLAPLVPRTHSYLAALRLPITHRPQLLSLCLGLPRQCLLLLLGKPRADTDALSSEACTTALRFAGILHRGSVGISRVTGPSFAHAPWSITPLNAPCPRPLTVTTLLPSGAATPWTFRIRKFRGCTPRLMRPPAYASPTSLPLPSQGSLPVCRAMALTGRAFHPLDDSSQFLEVIASFFPMRPA